MRLNSNGEVHTSREERILRRAWLQTTPPGNVRHLSTTFRLGYQDSNLRQSAQFRRPPRGGRAASGLLTEIRATPVSICLGGSMKGEAAQPDV